MRIQFLRAPNLSSFEASLYKCSLVASRNFGHFCVELPQEAGADHTILFVERGHWRNVPFEFLWPCPQTLVLVRGYGWACLHTNVGKASQNTNYLEPSQMHLRLQLSTKFTRAADPLK
jgi:hypothetical protein